MHRSNVCLQHEFCPTIIFFPSYLRGEAEANPSKFIFNQLSFALCLAINCQPFFVLIQNCIICSVNLNAVPFTTPSAFVFVFTVAYFLLIETIAELLFSNLL